MIFERCSADKFGQYQLRYDHRILFAEVSGAIGTGLSKKFVEHCDEIFSLIPDDTFTYLGNLRHCEGYTPESESMLIAINRKGVEMGCVVDAYLIESPVAMSQIQRIREAAGIRDDFQAHLFQQETQARRFLCAIMADIDHR